MPLQVMGRNKEGKEITAQHEHHYPQMRPYPFFYKCRVIDTGQYQIGDGQDKNVIVERQDFFADSKQHGSVSIDVDQVVA